jgi:hypothetical protein
VEAQIVPVAIYPNQPGALFMEEFFLTTPNQIHQVSPGLGKYAPVVHMIHVPSCTAGRLLQVYQDGQKQEGIGFFAYSDGQPEGHISHRPDEVGVTEG